MTDKHPKRRRDLNQWAKRMVDIATGEAQEAAESGPSKAASGSRGGTKRATLLNPSAA